MSRFFFTILCALFAHSSYAVDGFGYVVKVKRAQVHVSPSKGSAVVVELGITMPIALSRVNPVKGDWLHHEPALPTTQNGWVLRQDVAAMEDFKKVIGCWPIRVVEPPEGEATYRKIVFAPNGTATIVSNDESKWSALTFMVGELVLVRVTSRSKDAPFGEFLYLEEKTKAIFPNGEPPMHQEEFTGEQLKNCRQVVLK